MAVREQIFLHTSLAAAEIAEALAATVGGSVQRRGDSVSFLVDTARLVPGAPGRFGGPIVARDVPLTHPVPDEWEATDAYGVEMRLWQGDGPRIDPATGDDIERAAAGVLFDTMASIIPAPMLRVRDDDKLLSAVLPGRGRRDFPTGTVIYDWDEAAWEGYVVKATPDLKNGGDRTTSDPHT